MAESGPEIVPGFTGSAEELLKELRQRFPKNEYRIAPKDSSKVQRKYGQKWKHVCSHNRERNTCKDCGGTSICEHNRIRSTCKDCGGGSICQHKRARSTCKDCGGSQICEHNRRKSTCKDCGGGSICQHKRARSTCQECGGSSICEHNRRKSTCKDCGGASICQHNRRKSTCKDCGGASICQHNRTRSVCKDCGGTSICEHNRVGNVCKDCGGSSICEHNRERRRCKDCGGPSICEHNRIRSACKDCGGSQICEHNRRKSTCKDCGGSSICQHNRIRSQCKDCGGSSICPCLEFYKVKDGLCARCLKCDSEGCIGTPSSAFAYKFCYPCGCVKEGRTPQEKRQDKVFSFVESKYPDFAIRYDRQLPSQDCVKYRPDALFVLPHRKLIVEVDENSHKAGHYECETKRMSDLAAAGDVLPTVFIRFNPDLFRDLENNKRKIPLEKRLEKLQEEIDHWLDIETTQEHFITVVYLFYDKSDIREESSIPCDWSELAKEDLPEIQESENNTPSKMVKSE